MKISVKNIQPDQAKQACLIVGVYTDNKLSEMAKTLDKTTSGMISQVIKQGAITGKIGETLPLFLADQKQTSILLVGCGKQDKLSPMNFRKIALAAMKGVLSLRSKLAINYLIEVDAEGKPVEWKARQLAECSLEACYQFDYFKSEKQPEASLKEMIVHLPENKAHKAADIAIKQGLAIASGSAVAKNLGNTPSNICTPTFLAEQAKDMAKSYSNLKATILDEEKMMELGMGSLLAVAQGSAEEAKLICLEYNGSKKKSAPVALVGKGITFDTGGNSLKTPDSMVGMKYDMCGAAAVFGTIRAIAELKLPINVVGIIAAVENMPGGTAYKPEDILTSMSGQTIEVISTDAEGRLVLADALTYCEKYKPAAVIDIATLTGAAVIALGTQTSALMTNHQPLADLLLAAGNESNDRAWQLPLFEEYQEQLKSPFADMANTGGRAAGTITAGCFLSRFAKDYHWAHLDVAGTAAFMMGTGDRKATGRPVPLLTQYLINLSQ